MDDEDALSRTYSGNVRASVSWSCHPRMSLARTCFDTSASTRSSARAGDDEDGALSGVIVVVAVAVVTFVFLVVVIAL